MWTFAFEIANFVALATLLAWLFFKPIRHAIADQQAKTRHLEEDLEKKLADAQLARQEVESQRRVLDGELESMRATVREQTKQQAEQILADARAQIEKERATLKRDALHIERAQLASIASAATHASYAALKQFLHQIEGPDLERILIKSAIRELRSHDGDPLAPVTIESATELDDNARQLINACLGPSSETANYRVVPDLEGGLRISSAQGLVDASIKGLASFAEQSLSSEMESMLRGEAGSE